MTHPRHLRPAARALFWYLAAQRGRVVEVAEIVAESGIPRSSVYMAVRDYPDVFRLRGSDVHPTAAAHEFIVARTPPRTT